MKIGVLGTGVVGQTIAGRLSELEHEVVVGTRDVAGLLARSEPDAMGNPPFASWHGEHPQVGLGTFAEAAGHGDLVVNATSGGASLPALTAAGAENLAGKVILDVANPLDFSKGFPPTLFIKDTDSLAEQIQREFPESRVVKSLNTMNADLMVHPETLAGGDHSVFVSGDDDAAKAEVTDLLRSFGWRDIIDLGDLSSARGAEMSLPIWLRMMGRLGTFTFNFKIVR
jgi:predicted dinucleotide-binding enzyme